MTVSVTALRPTPTAGSRVVDVTGAVAITDAELVARARTRDAWAEEMIYRRHAPQVASVARRLLRDPVEAADVTGQALPALETVETAIVVIDAQRRR